MGFGKRTGNAPTTTLDKPATAPVPEAPKPMEAPKAAEAPKPEVKEDVKPAPAAQLHVEPPAPVAKPKANPRIIAARERIWKD
ncbi:MAG TPA: hypothetical protein VIN59_08360, partial [Alphaproteobacteria bacterium]